MKRSIILTVGVVSAAALAGGLGYFTGHARANGIPPTGALTYSGVLEDAAGHPAVGSHVFSVTVFGSGSSTDTTPLCASSAMSPPLDPNGRFSIVLPDACVTAVRQSPTAFVQVTVDGTSMPRAPLGAVPYAVEAAEANGLTASAALAIVPAGTVVAFAGMSPPSGWLLCDGTAVSRTTYPALFAAIGMLHGAGDGATTFNLPDYRGRFLRGADMGTMRDPDRLTRTAANAGGITGDNVGSVEAQAFLSHSHTYTATFITGSTTGGAGGYSIATTPPGGTFYSSSQDHLAGPIDGAGGNETRPINAAVSFIIRSGI